MTEILTACLLYHHAERHASVNMVEEAKTTKLRTIVDLLTEMEQSAKNFSFQPHVGYTGASGRPKIRVTKEQLTCRVDNGFKGTDMTCMLSISQATLNRRRKDFNLEISHFFSTIDDDTLDGIVRGKKEEFPNSGYRMVWGHLKGRGLVLQQWLHVTERRKYKVASPNALLAY
ncbi:unnamed protein product [Porites evermanni]|uniref:Transposase n=1 Tax=Porites evermanni TaxID=104178 RepID=A0ABN8PYX5_9CNID|nr:unnamed protein product [Porites evermanni]